MKLGKGRQYQAIAAKLQILANEQYAQSLKRQARQIQAHNRASAIERSLKEKYGPRTHVTIHMEPRK